MATKRKSKTDSDADLVKWILSCRDEAEEAKRWRMERNKSNFDLYHLRHDFSHKKKGQSREVLSKQPMAVEQISSFFQQSLVDVGDWFGTAAYDQAKEELMKIRPHEVHKIELRQLEKSNFFQHVGLGMKSGLLGALIISKIHGEFVDKPKFIAKKKKKKKGQKTETVLEKMSDLSWQLKIDLVRQEDFFPDPTGEGLYEIEEMWMDYHKIKDLSEGPNKLYNKEAVESLPRTMSETETDRYDKNRETDHSSTNHGHRARVKLTEYWGRVLDRSTGEVLHDNVVITLANDKTIIRGPEANPNWHQKSPFVCAALMDVPHAVWPKAFMDSPTQMNLMINEMYNLIVDGAMMAVNGISQVRTDMLKDPSQVSDGIPAGTALQVNSKLPMGGKVAEPVITADIPNDALSVLNLIQQEFNAAALTSDIRQGVTPARSVSATSVVETSQTITSVFQGLSKKVESDWIQPVLELAWMTICQNIDLLDKDELRVLLGDSDFEQIEDSSPQDIFASTVNGIKFRVYGIAETLSKQQDFAKWTTFLQTISSSEVLIEAFAQKYDFGKLLGEIIKSLGINKEKIELPEVQQQGDSLPEESMEEGGAPGAVPDQMSQVGAPQEQSLNELLGQTAQGQGGIPQSNFPGSPAVPGGNQ